VSDKIRDQAEVEPPAPRAAQPARTGASIEEIYIGIDYGTRFTKVAVGGAGQEPAVWTGSRGGLLIPSIVYITADGDVLPWPEVPPAKATMIEHMRKLFSRRSPTRRPSRGTTKIEYLKMLLARPDGRDFEIPASVLAGQEREVVAEALAALFLSEIIRRVQQSEREKPHLRNANIRWIVNVGMPVEHYDVDPVRDVFHKVASVAYTWAEDPPPDRKVDALVRAYQEQAGSDPNKTRASVFPELAAALFEHIRDPNTPEGLFGFCDIGGGTIDGAIYRINKPDRKRKSFIDGLAIFSASVKDFGAASVARSLVGKLGGGLASEEELALLLRVEELLVQKPGTRPNTQELATRLLEQYEPEFKNNIQNFVRKFVNDARMKHSAIGHTFADPVSGREIELRFFLAGGGAESGWYKTTLSFDPTHNPQDRNVFYGVRKVRLETVKGQIGSRAAEFPRFVIARGLAESPEELEEASKCLPSKIPRRDLPEQEPAPPIQLMYDD
jgi:hypothetical protein